MENLLAVSIALLMGLLMTRVLKFMRLSLPDVTAFLIAGLLVGPYCLGRVGMAGLGFPAMEDVDSMSVITNGALGFIAFSIGNEFRLKDLKEIGKQAFVIGIFQALAATLLVDITLIVLHFVLGPDVLPLPAAIVLGAIASATAPAATLMVVRQYKASGPLTNLLLPIVALDDAVGLIIFAVSIGVAQAVAGGELSVISIIVNPLIEIICSLALGALMGVILTELERLFYSNSNRMSLAISFVILTIALSSLRFELGAAEISFSSLLVCMMLGTLFCNMCDYSEDMMKRVDKWTSPLFATFFVISGAGLELKVFRYPSAILIGVLYILARSLGKYLGAWSSATATHCSKTVRTHLGITLLPQAGVALGMVVQAQILGDEIGGLIRNIILFSVMFYELVGPTLTKISLQAAGEIRQGATDKQNRERFQQNQA